MGEIANLEQFVLPTFSFVVTFVGADTKVEDFDRVLANLVLPDGRVVFRIGFHTPVGSLVKGKAYTSEGKEVWVKRIDAKSSRMEVVFGEVDPTEGVSYLEAVDPLVLPF